MNNLLGLLGQSERLLREWNEPFALVGGLAVGLRSVARTTRDVDLALGTASEKQAVQLIRHFHENGWMDRPDGAVFERRDGSGLALVRLVRSLAGDQPCVDLIFSLAGIEKEVVAAARPMPVLPSRSIPVARTGHLIALKILANRPQDLGDLVHLVDSADDEELALAFESVALIVERGFSEGRDLRAELEAFLARPKRPDPWVLRA